MGIDRNHSTTHHYLTFLAGGLAAAMVLLAGCFDVAYSTCDEISAEGIESLRVESDRGPIEVVGVEGAETVALSGAIHVQAASEEAADRRVEDIDLQLVADGSEAVLTLRIPPHVGPAYGDLVLTVPDHLRGDIATHDGRIRLTGLRAEQLAVTANGAIEVDDVLGDLTLETTNGPITVTGVEGVVQGKTTNGEVEIVDAHGVLTLSTTNGPIALSGGSGEADLQTSNGSVEVSEWSGDVLARTTNGHIDLDSVTGSADAETTNGAITAWAHSGDLDLSSSNGNIEMEVIVPAGGTVLAHTTNGPIDLIVPEDTAGSLMATTTNGVIDIENLPFEGTLTSDQAIGSLGCEGGTVEIVLSTTNGPIEIVGDGLLSDDCDDCGEESS